MDFIDLRTDTVTRPTEAMADAMRNATEGDDSRDGDPTVVKLEGLAARLTGKAAGVFMPSGTMTNLAALLTHGTRGGEVIVESSAHIMNTEMGGLSALGGLFPRPVPGRSGVMDIDAVRRTMRPLTRNNMGTVLVCLETSHNAAGGTVMPLDYMSEIYALCEQAGVPVHVDGARLFNAAVHLGVAASEIARHADSVCFCVSKGLSAPIGSLLCGSTDFVERARAVRRMVGGNMRQAGSIAAAGLVALETMIDRLKEDHATARMLGEGLHAIDERLCDLATVQTNIVRVQVGAFGKPAQEWSALMLGDGIRVSPAGPSALRFVTHRHIGRSDIERTVAAFRSAYSALT